MVRYICLPEKAVAEIKKDVYKLEKTQTKSVSNSSMAPVIISGEVKTLII
jgi:hypothetical protein